MKYHERTALILLLNFLAIGLYSQNIGIVGIMPVSSAEYIAVNTAALLKQLNWEKLKSYNDPSRHNTIENTDSLAITYEYYGGGAFFRIRSFDGSVMEFESRITNNSQESKSSFFDKSIWLSYAHRKLPGLTSDYKLQKNEIADVLKAYYQLLGVNTRDEYGWSCEAGARSKPTYRRLAVVQLVKKNKRELLKKLLVYKNIQTQLYAADALIYLDARDKEAIVLKTKELSAFEHVLDSLKGSGNKEKKQSVKLDIEIAENSIKYLKSQLLTKDEWKIIYDLRDSNKDVKTCANGTGSYKTYTEKTTALLSNEAILRIPGNYEAYKEIGLL